MVKLVELHRLNVKALVRIFGGRKSFKKEILDLLSYDYTLHA